MLTTKPSELHVEKTAEFGGGKGSGGGSSGTISLNLHNVYIVKQSGTIQKQTLIC